MTRIRPTRQPEKVQRGLLGDVASVGEGVSEMREFFGPGWRMYFVEQDGMLIMMLGGGDNSTQSDDVARARGMTEVARASGLTREALCKALSPTSHPRFDTIVRVRTALGVKLVAQPMQTEAACNSLLALLTPQERPRHRPSTSAGPQPQSFLTRASRPQLRR